MIVIVLTNGIYMRHRLQMFFSLQLLFCMELQLVSFLLNEYVMLCYYGLLFFVLISLLPFVHGKQRRLDLWNLSLTFNLLKSTTACIVLCSPGIHCCSILIKFFSAGYNLRKLIEWHDALHLLNLACNVMLCEQCLCVMQCAPLIYGGTVPRTWHLQCWLAHLQGVLKVSLYWSINKSY